MDDSTENSGAFRRGRDFGRFDDVGELHRRRIVLLPNPAIVTRGVLSPQFCLSLCN